MGKYILSEFNKDAEDTDVNLNNYTTIKQTWKHSHTLNCKYISSSTAAPPSWCRILRLQFFLLFCRKSEHKFFKEVEFTRPQTPTSLLFFAT